MVQSKAVEVEEIETVSEWELTEDEMRSILLPTPEEYREEMNDRLFKHIEKTEKTGIQKRTCIGVFVDKKTGEITYE